MALTTEDTQKVDPKRKNVLARLALVACMMFTVPLLAACEDESEVEEAIEESAEATEDAAEDAAEATEDAAEETAEEVEETTQ